jgi:hypothetical protein
MNEQNYGVSDEPRSVTNSRSFTPTSEAERTVVRAAEFLDSRDDFPDDWRDRIDLDTLEIADTGCVICQIIGIDRYIPFVRGTQVYDRFPRAFSSQTMTAPWRKYLAATRTAPIGGGTPSEDENGEPIVVYPSELPIGEEPNESSAVCHDPGAASDRNPLSCETRRRPAPSVSDVGVKPYSLDQKEQV